jgi:cysteine desulfurase family protein (TIGR01976 family)
MSFNLTEIRKQFPSLDRNVIFFDNPGGTQIARPSMDRMIDYMLNHNANHGGVFTTSRESDIILDQAHAAMAAFLNAASPDEIVFGANMTTLTFAVSRSIALEWTDGDCIVVTRLDHDGNISPWLLAAQDKGVEVIWVDFHREDGTLDLEQMQAAIERKPRLVAVGYASNALGTVNPVRQIIEWAHAAGALVYVDAVQYAAHGTIDVQELDCDFLACSAYKFFGPHVGILYGRIDLLERLFAYKVRPATNLPPGKFETGTLNHEGIAGVLGACEYLEWVGNKFGAQYLTSLQDRYTGKRLALKQAGCVIQEYEHELSRKLLDSLTSIDGLKVYGITDPARLEERVPTYSFTLQGLHPTAVAELLARANIYTWDGNYYALAVTQHLGIEDSGGMVRVGPVHYNSVEEIGMLKEALDRIAAGTPS